MRLQSANSNYILTGRPLISLSVHRPSNTHTHIDVQSVTEQTQIQQTKSQSISQLEEEINGVENCMCAEGGNEVVCLRHYRNQVCMHVPHPYIERRRQRRMATYNNVILLLIRL